jgi:dihydrofolate reductase
MQTGSGFVVSLIVAIADNGVIGREGGLPWRLSRDLRRFRALTMGHPLIMGRKTFQSIGRPLDGRDSIVVSKSRVEDPGRPDAPVFPASSLEEALELARTRALHRKTGEIFIIGGATLFSAALPVSGRIYLTRVHGAPEGDVRWKPDLGGDWKEISRSEHPPGPQDQFPVTDFMLERHLTVKRDQD